MIEVIRLNHNLTMLSIKGCTMKYVFLIMWVWVWLALDPFGNELGTFYDLHTCRAFVADSGGECVGREM